MGKPKPKMEVTKYYMSLHLGICNGPVDALLGVTIKEKTAWTGSQSAPAAFTVSNPELFGGVKKEGGVDGLVTYLPGGSDQLLPDFLAARLGRGTGDNCPGFRGLASLFFTGKGVTSGSGGIVTGGGLEGMFANVALVMTTLFTKSTNNYPGFYWTANSPYLPGVWATVRRTLSRSDGTVQWYAEKATIVQSKLSGAGQQWRYLQTAKSDATNYSASGFDDSGWSLGYAPFGNQDWTHPSPRPADNGFSETPATLINANYKYWARSTLSLTSIPSDLRFQCFLDNDASLYVNGNLIDTVGGPTGNYYEFAIDPSHLVVGNNIVAVVWTDRLPEASNNWFWFDWRIVDYTNVDINPAHIIHECLTSADLGMGAPTSILDLASFASAADTLFEENFGLSMMWTRQAAVEDFISEILDHIQAVLFVDPATGLLTLKLIRDDYDPDTLPVLSPDNADVTKFDRKLWGEIINEVIVTWTNPQNEQEETVVAQDLASIAMQGGNIVSASRNYYGVRNANLATHLGRRDLRTVGAPLSSCEVEIDRSAYALRPASVVKLTWPEHGLDESIMRVMSIDYGRPGDMTIRVTLMEDVFSLDAGAYVEPSGSEWSDPSSAPEPITEARVITLPVFLAAEAVAQNGGSDPVYPEVVAGILATAADTDTFAYSLQSELPLPDGSLQWTALGDNNIIGRGALVDPMVAEAATTGVTVTGFTGQTVPTQGGFALIGDSSDDETVMEIAMVTAFDDATGEFSLARGVMDTVPRAWVAGTQIWFVDGETLFEDRQVRSAGETVEYKLLSQTSQGQLTLAEAPLLTGTMTERPWLPLRPANVSAYGEAWSSEAELIDARGRPDPWVTVAWSNRNRLTEDSQILLWTDASVTPEAGQTTTIEVLAPDDTALATHDGLTGVSFDIPDASFGGEVIVKLRVSSEREGFESLQFFEHWVQVAPLTFDTTRITFDSDTWTMDQD